MSDDFNPDHIELPGYHLIGGEKSTDGDEQIAFTRPSDGRPVASYSAANATVVDRAARAAQKAFENSGWAQAAPSERAEILQIWANLIDRDRIRLARLEATTTTRPVKDMVDRDLVRAAGALRFFAEWADKIEGRYLAGKAGTTVLVRPEPYGVVGSIAPFNFPAINAIWKSGPALAVGNAIVLKPSELTPYSAVALAELAIEAGLPDGLFNVVLGAGETGSLLVRHPHVRKITFTGSSATGARVMSDAALSGTKPVTLELGGKTPQLVLRDVDDLDDIANHVVGGFTANGGQVCTAGTRLIVPRELEAPLLDRVLDLSAQKVAAPTWDSTCTLPPIITEGQCARIEQMLAETVKDGAEIIVGGSRVAERNEGAYFQPTVLRNVPDTSVGYTGEFFGPVLAVYPYDDEAQGIAMADHTTYALAASVYTNDARKAANLSQTLNAGTVWINTHGRQPDFSAPQGGFDGSGFGKEMGRTGVESFLRFKTVWHRHG